MNRWIWIAIIIFVVLALGGVGDQYLKPDDPKTKREQKKDECSDDIEYIHNMSDKIKNKKSSVNIFNKKNKLDEFKKHMSRVTEYITFCQENSFDLYEDEVSLQSEIDDIDLFFEPDQALERIRSRSIKKYDESYQNFINAGESLFEERNNAVDTIHKTLDLINSISLHPKEIDDDITIVEYHKDKFIEDKNYGSKHSDALKSSVATSAAGVVAGSAFAASAPSVALWLASTFGTASTGSAISALSGAAATNAALAWLGGGAIAAGGGGIAAGHALLALAGPIGIGIASATTLWGILSYLRKKKAIQESKKEEIKQIDAHTIALNTLQSKLINLFEETKNLRKQLAKQLTQANSLRSYDYSKLSNKQQTLLGSIVNNAMALSKLIAEKITE